MTNIKTIQTDVLDQYALDGKLTDVIDRLTTILLSIPEKYRETAIIDIEVDQYNYDQCQIIYHITYQRPETTEERGRRLKEMREYKKRMMETERQQYLILKGKYEKS